MLKNRFLSSFAAMVSLYGLQAQAIELALSEAVPKSDSLSELAATDVVTIDGDKLVLQMDKSMRATGNAVIHRGDQAIMGDDIEYDVQNDQLNVIGNARITLGDTHVSGPELHMRLSENIGEMRDATILLYKNLGNNPLAATNKTDNFSKKLGSLQSQQIGGDEPLTNDIAPTQAENSGDKKSPDSPQSRGDAKAIFFEGQDKKRLTNARYTTCAAGVDDWYLKAKELKLNDFTESGVAKNAYLEFKGAPLFYTPWISFSYNNQRKSGLLAPSYGTTSKSGFELSMPYYWNISPNMDATIAARLLSKRGLQLQSEFRYLEDTFSGIDNIEFLPNDNQNSLNRYYAGLKHQQSLGNGWSAGYSFEKVSDDQYFADLSTRIVTTSIVNLPQQFNLDYANETWSFNALAQKYQTLDKASYPYQRLPQMTLTGTKHYSDVDASLYTQLVAFGTNSHAPKTVTGIRATAYPSVSWPITKSYGYLTPKVGIHLTSYSLNNDPNQSNSIQRTLPIVSLDGGLFFDRTLTIADQAYSQTLEPRMFYTYIPNANQASIPIFDTSESDLNFSSLFSENQFSGNDRINNANQLSLALTTRLIETDSGVQRLSASVGQRYYFTDQQVAMPNTTLRKNNSSDIIAGASANLIDHWNADIFWQYNTNDARSVRTTMTSRYLPEPGKVLNLSYSYRRDSLDQFDASAQWPLGKGWYGIGRANYSLREKKTIEALGGLEYDAGCWQARSVIQRVSTATATPNYGLFFQLELGGIASIGANPLTVIKRNIPGYVKTGLIPDTYQQPYYE